MTILDEGKRAAQFSAQEELSEMLVRVPHQVDT